MGEDMIDLREVMRRWVTGVSIVTVESRGLRHGATVSSLASISVEPPLITVTLASSSRTHQMLLESGSFGVSLLALEQQPLAERFSGQVADEHDRFDSLAWEYILDGIPVISGALASLGCQLVHQYSMSSSTLFVAQVKAASLGQEHAPLVYVNRSYRRLEDQ
jgi:flavin reductase (DIM6/NTAB) family NADH-FMN oxidoreductase RutF